MERPSYLAGLIGSGVTTSLTPPMHEREGARHELNYVYRTIDIAALNLATESAVDLIDAARSFGFDGLNITHPCKSLVIPHLERLSPEAEALRAVNTVVFTGGKAIGYNTDVTGFARSFARGLPDVATSHVVQVGAGGAGSAVAHALLDSGTARLVLVDADVAQAEALAQSLRSRTATARVEVVERTQLGQVMATVNGVVNATPVGMAAYPGMAVPEEALRPDLWVADIVYRPLQTALIRSAKRAGCPVLTGAGMAVFQAGDAFRLITGREPDLEVMFSDFEEFAGPGDTRPPGAARGAH